MHGRQTASKHVEMAQELLGTKSRESFNMPLVMEVQTMYEEVLQICQKLSRAFDEWPTLC